MSGNDPLPGDPPCVVCGGERTWWYHAYCRPCNNERKRQWLAVPGNRERKREHDREYLRRQAGKGTRPKKREDNSDW